MDKQTEYKPLLNIENHNCFGCSPINPSGLQMKFYSKEDSIFSWINVPEHLCGWQNLVHGGVISAILDEIMGRAGLYFLKKLILTKEMNVKFLNPVFIGKELMAQGKVVEIINEREAIMEGFLYNGKNQLCARSTGTFSLFSPSSLKKKGVMDESLIDDLISIMNE